MLSMIRNEKGTALVTALFFIAALSLTATVIVWVTGSERRVAHNEYTHMRSFYASDAGSETAINWLRTRTVPPTITDLVERFVENQTTYTSLYSDHQYKYDVRFDRIRFRPGWSGEYLDFDYTIDSFGASVNESTSRIEVRTSRLFRQGY